MSSVASFFLKLTKGGPGAAAKAILGEATDAEYKHQIEVSSLSWEVARTATSTEARVAGAATPMRSAGVQPSVVKFTKHMCRATSAMLAAMEDGDMLTAVFALEEDSDTDFLLEVTLSKVRILDYSLDLEGTEVKESWQLDYAEVTFDYRPDYKQGKLTTTLRRQAGAPTAPPADNSQEGKILSMAERMSPIALKSLVKKLDTQANRPSPLSAAADKKTGGKPGGG